VQPCCRYVPPGEPFYLLSGPEGHGPRALTEPTSQDRHNFAHKKGILLGGYSTKALHRFMPITMHQYVEGVSDALEQPQHSEKVASLIGHRSVCETHSGARRILTVAVKRNPFKVIADAYPQRFEIVRNGD
jgi:hypothetical protein